jgi:hypothetical protein
MRRPTSPLHHGLLHLALALLLLFAQQRVLHHALEHEADPDHHATHSECLTCLAGHAVGHACAGTPAQHAWVNAATHVLRAGQNTSVTLVWPALFRARAPPAFWV